MDAIEPHPRIVRFLRANIAMNHFTQVRVHQCALAAEPGLGHLTDRHGDDMNRLVSTGAGAAVAVRRLDDLDTGAGPIALLKVDVEGHELPVLRGALRTLARAEVVMIECAEAHFRPLGYGTPAVTALLREAGFTCLRRTAGGYAIVAEDYRSERAENLLAARDAPMLLRRLGATLV